MGAPQFSNITGLVNCCLSYLGIAARFEAARRKAARLKAARLKAAMKLPDRLKAVSKGVRKHEKNY